MITHIGAITGLAIGVGAGHLTKGKINSKAYNSFNTAKTEYCRTAAKMQAEACNYDGFTASKLSNIITDAINKDENIMQMSKKIAKRPYNHISLMKKTGEAANKVAKEALEKENPKYAQMFTQAMDEFETLAGKDLFNNIKKAGNKIKFQTAGWIMLLGAAGLAAGIGVARLIDKFKKSKAE